MSRPAPDTDDPAAGAPGSGTGVAAESADERADDHIDDLPGGACCTESWEHLSPGREGDGSA